MKCKYSFGLTISLFGLVFSLANLNVQAQSVAISAETTHTPNANAILDVSSTTKGVLLPRLTTTQRNGINPAAAANGLMIYNTTTSKFNYWDGTRWNDVGTGSGGFVPMWYYGSENPPIDVIATGVSYLGVSGDFFVNNNSGKLFKKGSDNIWKVERTFDQNIDVKLNSTFKTTITAYSAISIDPTNSKTQSFSMLNASVGDVVSVSPKEELPDGVVIAYARVKAAGEVEVKFLNTTGAPVVIASSDYYISVTK